MHRLAPHALSCSCLPPASPLPRNPPPILPSRPNILLPCAITLPTILPSEQTPNLLAASNKLLWCLPSYTLQADILCLPSEPPYRQPLVSDTEDKLRLHSLLTSNLDPPYYPIHTMSLHEPNADLLKLLSHIINAILTSHEQALTPSLLIHKTSTNPNSPIQTPTLPTRSNHLFLLLDVSTVLPLQQNANLLDSPTILSTITVIAVLLYLLLSLLNRVSVGSRNAARQPLFSSVLLLSYALACGTVTVGLQVNTTLSLLVLLSIVSVLLVLLVTLLCTTHANSSTVTTLLPILALLLVSGTESPSILHSTTPTLLHGVSLPILLLVLSAILVTVLVLRSSLPSNVNPTLLPYLLHSDVVTLLILAVALLVPAALSSYSSSISTSHTTIQTRAAQATYECGASSQQPNSISTVQSYATILFLVTLEHVVMLPILSSSQLLLAASILGVFLLLPSLSANSTRITSQAQTTSIRQISTTQRLSASPQTVVFSVTTTHLIIAGSVLISFLSGVLITVLVVKYPDLLSSYLTSTATPIAPPAPNNPVVAALHQHAVQAVHHPIQPIHQIALQHNPVFPNQQHGAGIGILQQHHINQIIAHQAQQLPAVLPAAPVPQIAYHPLPFRFH